MSGQMPERNNMKRGRVHFGLGFQRFHAAVVWVHFFWAATRQSIRAEIEAR